eukprot:Nitzschia sp. Nitz4//scaffold3_size479765//257023//258380//NITZ4_000107-RA/size479765-processed-gene-1.461-mRNA-1//1//CDS//3329550779//2878//frame0
MVSLIPNTLVGFVCKAVGGRLLHQSQALVPQNVAIVGGGFAGLSTAYHLHKKDPLVKISIFDRELPGAGGASAVAGGLLHPLSPKGKLAHLGLEGLAAANEMVEVARQFESRVVLRNEIYRMAVTDDNVRDLKNTASNLPDIASWMQADDLPWDAPKEVKGALRLHSGCKVVHTPSYLRGIWQALQNEGASWEVVDPSSDSFSWKHVLGGFDAVVFCAGSGLFTDSVITSKLPIQLVRGQSVEFPVDNAPVHAMICGKYVSPTLNESWVHVGATQEFSDDKLSNKSVLAELQEKTSSFVPNIWDNIGADEVQYLNGFRVQSNRSRHGRIPIVGKIQSDFHENSWIFTGLSSRGLLYHGIFGEMLVNKFLDIEGDHSYADIEWWVKR